MILKFYFDKQHPQRLANFLNEKNISRQALIKVKKDEAMILVNKKRRLPNFKLNSGDIVHFIIKNEPENKKIKPIFKSINVIFENNNYLIVDKPANLLSIPSRFENDSVVTRLLAYFTKKNEPNILPHVVTRLDKDTSGLVLVAKSGVIHGAFSTLTKSDFIKEYAAIVHHPFLDNEEHLIEAPIKKLPDSIVHVVDQKGKDAATIYRASQNFENAAFVKLQLLTGRTHQIRVHMNYLDHPLFGDQVYGISDDFKRQMLHCTYLKFIDPLTNKTMEFKSDLPTDMKKILTRLEDSKNEKKR